MRSSPLLRRALLLTVAVGMLASPAPAAVGQDAEDPEDPEERPNVLLVVTDDMRWDQLPALPETTRWLADEGTTFTNGVSNSPVCCPARASILTGQYNHNNGVLTQGLSAELSDRDLLPTTLREAGYRTALAGKLLSAWDLCDTDPPGFERFAVMTGGYTDVRFRLNREPGDAISGTSTTRSDGACPTGDDDQVVTVAENSTTFVSKRAVDDLRTFEDDDAAPWFLYVAPFAPHAPFATTAACLDAPVPAIPDHLVVERHVGDKLPHVRDISRSRRHVTSVHKKHWRRMARSLCSVDHLMAQLYKELANLDELDDTLVVFTSDQGYLLGEHQLLGKREPYGGSVRVPLLMSWPERIPAGHRDDRIVGLVDLAPTIYAAAGIEPPYVVDGVDALGPTRRSRILVEHHRAGHRTLGEPGWAAWWSPSALYRGTVGYGNLGSEGCVGGGKGVICQRYDEMPGRAEFYGPDDPGQLENLVARGAPRAWYRRLQASLRAQQECAGSACADQETSPLPEPRPRASLSVTAPRRAFIGDRIVVKATLTNLGGATLPAAHVELESNRGWRGGRTGAQTPRLRPGESTTVTFRVTFSRRGAASVGVTASWDEQTAWDAFPIVVEP